MKQIALALLIAIYLASFGHGRAQVLDPEAKGLSGQPARTEARVTNSVHRIDDGFKSASIGRVWATAGTLVPLLVAIQSGSEASITAAVIGVYVGPSLGNLYAGDLGRGLGGVGLRVTGTFLMALGIGEDLFDDSDDNPAAAWAGLGLFIGSTVWNFVSVSGSVDRYNRRKSEKLVVVPMVDASGGGGITARIQL